MRWISSPFSHFCNIKRDFFLSHFFSSSTKTPKFKNNYTSSENDTSINVSLLGNVKAGDLLGGECWGISLIFNHLCVLTWTLRYCQLHQVTLFSSNNLRGLLVQFYHRAECDLPSRFVNWAYDRFILNLNFSFHLVVIWFLYMFASYSHCFTFILTRWSLHSYIIPVNASRSFNFRHYLAVS